MKSSKSSRQELLYRSFLKTERVEFGLCAVIVRQNLIEWKVHPAVGKLRPIKAYVPREEVVPMMTDSHSRNWTTLKEVAR